MGLRRNDKSLREDERAIEGLPIRLVIALFVGVAALGLMLQVLGIFDEDQLSTSEANIEITNGEVVNIVPGEGDISDPPDGDPVVEFEIRNGDGERLSSVNTVLLSPDTAQGETVTLDVTDGTGEITEEQLINTANASLRADQTEGSFEISLVESDESDFDQVNEGAFTLLN